MEVRSQRWFNKKQDVVLIREDFDLTMGDEEASRRGRRVR